jgi:phage terminase small subunit
MGNRVCAITTPTAKEEAFLQAKEMGMHDTQAAAFAGYSNPSAEGKRLRAKPHIAVKLSELELKIQQEMDLHRHDVQKIVMEAIEMGRIQADPVAMLRGAQELNKMCGFYAAEVKEVRLSSDLQQRQKQLEGMSDEELLRQAEMEGGFDVIIDAEFTEVTDAD